MNTLPSRIHDSKNGLDYTLVASPILKLKAVSLSTNTAD